MNWSPSNWRLAGVLLTAFFASLIPIQPTYFGWLPWMNALAGLAYIFAGLVTGSLRFTMREIERYQPASALEAKRVNEQIKLTATFCNMLAAAVVSVVALAELARSATPNYTLIVIFGSIGFIIHVAARSLLSRLKDEAVEAGS